MYLDQSVPQGERMKTTIELRVSSLHDAVEQLRKEFILISGIIHPVLSPDYDRRRRNRFPRYGGLIKPRCIVVMNSGRWMTRR